MLNTANIYFSVFHPQYRIFGALLLGIAINAYAIPVIIRIAKKKHLFDVPDARKTHGCVVPTLGGLGIYVTVVTLCLTLINTCGMDGGKSASNFSALSPVVAGFTLIFFIGLKDDLLNISAWKKLAVECIAMFILIVIGDVRLNSLQGMFSIYELNYFVSCALSLFAGIVIINAYNLIDGIDGLAASITMLGSLAFGYYFFEIHQWEYAVLTAAIVGALIPFIYYNAFGKENKIFMGDTGSLILGFAITVLVFRFNQLNSMPNYRHCFVAAPAFSLAVVILPMFDTLRVFVIRVFRGGSPFNADRRHMHHVLLDIGFTHLQATSILIFVNFLFILYAHFFNQLGNSVLVYSMLLCAIFLSGLAIWVRRRAVEKKKKAELYG